ncbi:glycosyltransferase family 2 protein [bacterium]|nr:glycosyltransferase family 2 protein [candidate division CSSED10-310 bacterium]
MKSTQGFSLPSDSVTTRRMTSIIVSPSPPPRIAVVIPIHNEELFIRDVIRTVPSWVYRIIVVDDGSTDDGITVTEQTGDQRVSIVRHTRNQGVGAAIVTGYRAALDAHAEIVVVIGGDGQMDPRDMESLIQPLVTGIADYVKGNRFTRRDHVRRIPWRRRLGIRVFTEWTRWAAGNRSFGDAQCGYTACTDRLLRSLDLDRLHPGYGFPNHFIIETLTAGFQIREQAVKPIYGSEVSGIHPFRDLPRLMIRLLAWGFARWNPLSRIMRLFRREPGTTSGRTETA